MTKRKQCLVCGVTYHAQQIEYHMMSSLRQHYAVVGYADLCDAHGFEVSELNVGELSQTRDADRAKLYQLLINGILPQRCFAAQMNGGYY